MRRPQRDVRPTDQAVNGTLFSLSIDGAGWAANSEVHALVEAPETGRTTVIVYASRSNGSRPLDAGSIALYIEFAGVGERVTERTRDAFANGGLISFSGGGGVYESVAFELAFTEVSDRVVRGTVAAVMENKERPSDFVIMSEGEFVASVVGGF